MEPFDFDLFVIGAGSGGVRASRLAAATGARVAVAEDRYPGGTCVNAGCIPKKLFVYGAQYARDFAEASGYGWQLSEPRFDWAQLRDNKTREINRLQGIYSQLLEKANVQLLTGRARLEGPHTVMINDTRYSARHILLAPGARPFVPSFPGSEHVDVSDQMFDLDQFPGSILIVGGGYIAVEFAGIFHELGAETHLCFRRDLLLNGFDMDMRHHLQNALRGRGVKLHPERTITRIDKQDDGSLLVTWDDGETASVDRALYATGRLPNTQGMGLEEAGVALDARGAVVVDSNFQTSIPSIFALGDVIDRLQLTPVALAEANALVNYLYGDNKPIVMDYDNIATAVFSQPCVATVGLSEEQARDQYKDIKIFRSSFRTLKSRLGGSEEQTLMKLVVDSHSDRVLGCHMAGPDAGEIIQGFAVALKAGATKKLFDSTVGVHPTSAEEFVTMRG